MRKEFFEFLYGQMRDKRIYAITADLGYKGFDNIRNHYSSRYLNTGAAEQTMMDIAVGLAHAGKLPVTYTITPFYYRAFETLRTYIDYEKIPVLMVGSGRDDDYKHDGYSHDASDIALILNTLPNIKQVYPHTVEEMKQAVLEYIREPKPTFLSLKR